MLNFCCLELSVVERTAFRIAPCQYKAPRKLVDQNVDCSGQNKYSHFA